MFVVGLGKRLTDSGQKYYVPRMPLRSKMTKSQKGNESTSGAFGKAERGTCVKVLLVYLIIMKAYKESAEREGGGTQEVNVARAWEMLLAAGKADQAKKMMSDERAVSIPESERGIGGRAWRSSRPHTLAETWEILMPGVAMPMKNAQADQWPDLEDEEEFKGMTGQQYEFQQQMRERREDLLQLQSSRKILNIPSKPKSSKGK